MPWGRLDDKLHENGKAWTAGTASMGLWVLANSWCCDNLQTDGFVPSRVLRRWNDPSIDGDVEQVAENLVSAGLWHRSKQGREDGFLFHDWDQYRPESGRASQDAKRGNHVRWHANVGIIKPDCEYCINDAVSPSQTEDDRGDIGATSGRIGGESHPDTRNPNTRIPDAGKELDQPQAVERPIDPPEFDRFWDAYPRHIGKGQARKAWKTAAKKTDPETIIIAASAFTARVASNDPRFIPHPSTWLNGERWTDEPDPDFTSKSARQADSDSMFDRQMTRAAARDQQDQRAIGA